LGAINGHRFKSRRRIPADGCQWCQLQKEFPLIRRGRAISSSARGLSHASLAHKNPIKVAVVTEAGGRTKQDSATRCAVAVPVRRDRPGQRTPGQLRNLVRATLTGPASSSFPDSSTTRRSIPGQVRPHDMSLSALCSWSFRPVRKPVSLSP
jgi:hypothetical protein